MYLHGISFAVASLGCTVAPFLVVTAATFTASKPVAGLAAYLAYAAGMGLLVGSLAIAAALGANTLSRRLRRLTPMQTRAAGLLLVGLGGYIAWYGGYELRLNNGGAGPDPVVDTATRLQGKLASYVDQVHPAFLTAGLFGLLLLAALASRRRRRPAPNLGNTRTPTAG